MAFYFTTLRPVCIGTCPRGFKWFNNFENRIYVPCINHRAWGVIEYEKELSERETNSYDLVKADLEWVTCYRDLYEHGHDCVDNLMDILVPKDWLKESCNRLTEYDYETFENEYTADDTEALYFEAEKNNLIYGRIF